MDKKSKRGGQGNQRRKNQTPAETEATKQVKELRLNAFEQHMAMIVAKARTLDKKYMAMILMAKIPAYDQPQVTKRTIADVEDLTVRRLTPEGLMGFLTENVKQVFPPDTYPSHQYIRRRVGDTDEYIFVRSVSYMRCTLNNPPVHANSDDFMLALASAVITPETVHTMSVDIYVVCRSEEEADRFSGFLRRFGAWREYQKTFQAFSVDAVRVVNASLTMAYGIKKADMPRYFQKWAAGISDQDLNTLENKKAEHAAFRNEIAFRRKPPMIASPDGADMPQIPFPFSFDPPPPEMMREFLRTEGVSAEAYRNLGRPNPLMTGTPFRMNRKMLTYGEILEAGKAAREAAQGPLQQPVQGPLQQPVQQAGNQEDELVIEEQDDDEDDDPMDLESDEVAGAGKNPYSGLLRASELVQDDNRAVGDDTEDDGGDDTEDEDDE